MYYRLALSVGSALQTEGAGVSGHPATKENNRFDFEGQQIH